MAQKPRHQWQYRLQAKHAVVSCALSRASLEVDLGEDTARWHSEDGADFIAFTAMLALGHMSQNEVNTPLTALVEPAIEGLKKPLLLRRISTAHPN